MMTPSSGYVAMARLAEQAERYSDMCAEMKKAIEASDGVISEEERNLFSVAYKTVVGERRTSWRAINGIEKKMEEGDSVLPHVKSYKEKIQTELTELCTEVLEVLNNSLLAKAADNYSKVFYTKMKADYLRYLAEVAGNDHEAKRIAADIYKEAWEISIANLAPTHPIHLGLALNYSVYYYEILEDKPQACQLAKQAFDEAIARLDQLTEDLYKDSTLIMQLLHDNLNLWSGGEDDDEVIE